MGRVDEGGKLQAPRIRLREGDQMEGHTRKGKERPAGWNQGQKGSDPCRNGLSTDLSECGKPVLFVCMLTAKKTQEREKSRQMYAIHGGRKACAIKGRRGNRAV